MAVVQYRFPNVFQLTSAYHDRIGPNDDGGNHGKGLACDISNAGNEGSPEMKALAQWWYENFLGKGLLELIHSPFNNNVGHDRNVGDGMTEYYNPGTMSEHRNHVHIAMAGVVSADGTTSGISGSLAGAGGNIQWENKLAKNLFTFLFEPERYNDALSEELTGKHASLNDQPLINIIKTICSARMCQFQSTPDGQFLAFYPDYFGLHGDKPPELTLEDIEIKDFTISINDNSLATHVWVQGANGSEPGGVLTGVDAYFTSPGIVTVEDEWLFQLATSEMYFSPEFTDAEEFLGRYGVRPFRDRPHENINSMDNPAAMLVVAIRIFMERWAQQYDSQVQLTFMPELLPGMRVHLISHGLVVYVQSVRHSFDYNSGFTTSASVMAPMKPQTAQSRQQLWEDIIAKGNAAKDKRESEKNEAK